MSNLFTLIGMTNLLDFLLSFYEKSLFIKLKTLIYQVCLSENFVFVSPLFEADCDWFAASHSRSIWSSPDLNNGNLSTDLKVVTDHVSDLRFSHRRMLFNTNVRFDSVKHLDYIEINCCYKKFNSRF